jgi:hypothetical protein
MNNIPDWAKKYKTKGIYIRNVGNSCYAYRTRSKWDKENKRTRTPPPEYIGVVTHSGIINLLSLWNSGEDHTSCSERAVSLPPRENNQLYDFEEHIATAHEINKISI